MSRVHPKVDEAVETLNLNPLTRRRLVQGAGLFSASLAASALLAGCTDDPVAAAWRGRQLPEDAGLEIQLRVPRDDQPVLHTHQYGAEDACKLLGVEFQWTGSVNSVVAEMVDATNTAITSKADGLALAVVDKEAIPGAGRPGLDAGIPVVSFNADDPAKTRGRTGWPPSARDCTNPGTPWASAGTGPDRLGRGRRLHRHGQE